MAPLATICGIGCLVPPSEARILELHGSPLLSSDPFACTVELEGWIGLRYRNERLVDGHVQK